MSNRTIKIFVTALVICANIFISFMQSRQSLAPAESSVAPESSAVSSEKSDFAPTQRHSIYDLKDVTLTELKAYNSDTVGWMKIDGTLCDDVVVLGEDEVRGQNYYLDHSFDHRSTTAGTLYIDYKTSFTADYLSQNITIYGHHLLDGTKYAQIKRYRDINFYKAHPYFTFETIYGEYDCQVFALFTVDLTTDYGLNFDFRGPDYDSEEAFLSFIDEVRKRSEIYCPVEIEGDARIVTLTTCTYISDDARLIVMAKLVPKGEGGSVDVSGAYKKQPK